MNDLRTEGLVLPCNVLFTVVCSTAAIIGHIEDARLGAGRNTGIPVPQDDAELIVLYGDACTHAGHALRGAWHINEKGVLGIGSIGTDVLYAVSVPITASIVNDFSALPFQSCKEIIFIAEFRQGDGRPVKLLLSLAGGMLTLCKKERNA